mgnify:CR=1 FL=1
MALLNGFLELREPYHLELMVAHVDHQLRADSAAESKLLQEFCQQREVALVETKWDQGPKLTSGLEAAAREFRYQFFESVLSAQQAQYLVTAHHGDDVLENLLIKLVRSGNPQEMSSLQSIRTQDFYQIVRPLLACAKDELRDYCQQHELPYLEDETNATDFTIRNRLRHHVVPELRRENPRIIKNANQFTQEVTMQTELLNYFLKQLPAPSTYLTPGILKGQQADLQKLPGKYQPRLLEYWVQKYFHKVVKVAKLSKQLELGQSVKLSFGRESFYLTDESLIKRDLTQIKISSTRPVAAKILGTFYAAPDFDGEISLVQPGQRIKLQDGHSQKLKKKFAEADVPAGLRQYFVEVRDHKSGEIVFVENVFEQQAFNDGFLQYWVTQS